MANDEIPDGRLVTVRDTRLFVEERGALDAPALLYLHGGPGMGCHEFMHWQGAALSAGLRVIGFDQRGTLRSDPIGADSAVSEDILVEDCEALRRELGIESWALLGHSFGGRLALRYAHRYPQRITAVVFENPSWDVEATERYRLPVLAAEYARLGEAEAARECRELAASPDLFAGGYRLDLIGGLEPLGHSWFLADQHAKPLMEQARADLPEEVWEHTGATAMRLIGDPGLFESLTPLLSGLPMPALLISGKSDLVCPPDLVDAFRQSVPRGRVEVLDPAGHFAQFEQAERYAALVAAFVLEHGSGEVIR